ncbi:MAG: MmgE/PrpD family protein, partial [Pseudomonadota bacterium]
AEREGGVSGADLLEAVILGVDVAASLGVGAASGLRFFRPATVGAFGGVAAMGKLRGMDQEALIQSFSLAYGQLCGTMQAHTEGSLLLAMQMGFNARNAVTASDFAAAGFTGPRQILMGDFGYYRLIEDGGTPAEIAETLGRDWRITELAHKPFPSGRATHGILDGCLALQRAHGFAASDVRAIDLDVPPLIQHLVGRPPRAEMAINYARLCARYVTAAALTGQGVRFEDFNDAAYARTDVQDLAGRIALSVREDDPNALAPIGIRITLKDGARLEMTVTDVYGAPANPMTRDAQIEKLHMNADSARADFSGSAVQDLVAAVDDLEVLSDVTALVDLTIGT